MIELNETWGGGRRKPTCRVGGLSISVIAFSSHEADYRDGASDGLGNLAYSTRRRKTIERSKKSRESISREVEHRGAALRRAHLCMRTCSRWGKEQVVAQVIFTWEATRSDCHRAHLATRARLILRESNECVRVYTASRALRDLARPFPRFPYKSGNFFNLDE